MPSKYNHSRQSDQDQQKLKLVKDFQRFRALSTNKRKSFSRAAEDFAKKHGIASTTFRRWLQQYNSGGADALIDQRGGGISNENAISEKALETFKLIYLSPQKPSLALCWRFIRFIDKEENHGWSIPSLRVMYNLIKRHIPEPLQLLRREGFEACESEYGGYISRLIRADCDGQK